MTSLIVETLCILVIVAINGYLAMAEMAIISARKSLLRTQSETGDKKARLALSFAEKPGELLSAIQLGITSLGILAGVFSGATISLALCRILEKAGLPTIWAELSGIALVVTCISLLSLIFGELTPKRLALSNPEETARATAYPLKLLVLVLGPAASLLNEISTALVKKLRSNAASRSRVSDAEIKELMAEGRRSGSFRETEADMISGILKLDQIAVDAILTPNTELDWLDISDSQSALMNKLRSSKQEKFPVAKDSLDEFSGMVNARDLLLQYITNNRLAPEECLFHPHIVPENKNALELLEDFQRSRIHAALVLDEYGAVKGMVTADDILETVTGHLREFGESIRWEAIPREDDSWLVDAYMPISSFNKLFALRDTNQTWYHTTGGLVIHKLGRIPKEGDICEIEGLRIEVVDMDVNRIDKLLIRKIKTDKE